MSAQPVVHRGGLGQMRGGWFIGDFEPAVLHSTEAEVAVQHFPAGKTEACHEHRLATEVTLLLSGRALMCGTELAAGDIVVLPPGSATSFEALEDCVTVVVKTPSAPGDKHAAAEVSVARDAS